MNPNSSTTRIPLMDKKESIPSIQALIPPRGSGGHYHPLIESSLKVLFPKLD